MGFVLFEGRQLVLKQREDEGEVKDIDTRTVLTLVQAMLSTMKSGSYMIQHWGDGDAGDGCGGDDAYEKCGVD